MKTRVAQVITIVLFALVMGVFWGTWFSLSRTMSQLSPETFLAVGHEMIQNLGTPMSILLPFALLSALITLVLARQEGHAAAFRWVAAGFLLMVAALVITLAAVAIGAVITGQPADAGVTHDPRGTASRTAWFRLRP